MRKQMGKKLNDLFKATLQINLKLGLCGWHSCLMFLFSNVMIWCQVNPRDPGLRSILYLRVLLRWLQTFPLNSTPLLNYSLIPPTKMLYLIYWKVLCFYYGSCHIMLWFWVSLLTLLKCKFFEGLQNENILKGIFEFPQHLPQCHRYSRHKHLMNIRRIDCNHFRKVAFRNTA